jgi:hypothetical protein
LWFIQRVSIRPVASSIGGYGMFVRLMRDGGFDFHREDPLCDNLFAQGFDRQDDGTFELVTAFEVFEQSAADNEAARHPMVSAYRHVAGCQTSQRSLAAEPTVATRGRLRARHRPQASVMRRCARLVAASGLATLWLRSNTTKDAFRFAG